MNSNRRSTPLLFVALFAVASALAAKPVAIELHVLSTAGGDVAGAAIEIAATAGDPFTASGLTDAAGTFRFEAPDAKGQYRIQVSRDEFHGFDQSVDLKGQKPVRGKPLVLTAELRPFNAVDFFNVGVAHLRTKELAGAEAEFRKAIALDPELARGWGVLAMIEIESGRNQEALDDATRARALDPADMQALRTRHEALLALEQTAAAESALTELYQQDRSEDTVRLLFNSGALAANSGDSETARARLAQAIELDPKLWQAHTALAELAVREQRLEDAVGELNLALGIAPRNFKAWERKIEILRALGKESEAETETARLGEARAQR